MAKHIIGVHGLANKPSKKILSGWWVQAINEGLGYIGSDTKLSDSQFDMVFWADLMYVKPQSENEPEGSPFRLVQTFTKAGKKPERHEEGFLDWTRARVGDAIDDVLDNIDCLDTVADVLMQLKLKDLAVYWNKVRAMGPGLTAQDVLCDYIRNNLEAHSNDEVMLLSHSMGTIISLDALIQHPELGVEHFVTMGSPLGLPRVKRRIAKESGQSWPVIPDNIKQWTNFSDHGDPVCGDPFLNDDYRTSAGKKMIKDDIVVNGYEFRDLDGEDRCNCHKSYGYLRCPEVAECIEAFLGSKSASSTEPLLPETDMV